MATIRVDIESRNQAARELIRLREQLNALNRRLAQQQQLLRSANTAERKNIQAKISAIQALQRQNKLEQESARIKQQLARQTARETQAVRMSEGNFRRLAQVIVRTTSSYGGFIESIGSTAFVFNLAGFYIGRFIQSMVDVSAEAERFNSVLKVTTSDAGAVGSQLRQLQRDLVVTDFSTITKTFNALNAATGDVERSIGVIRGFGTALNTLNTTLYDQSRFFVQLRQLYGQNRLELDEFKILQETLPNIIAISNRALGIQASGYEDIKEHLDAANISVREYIDTVANFATAELPGVDPSTYTAQVSQLNETIRQIQREIGQRLIPILAQGAGALNSFLKSFSLPAVSDIISWTAAIAGAVVALKALTFQAGILRAAVNVPFPYQGVEILGFAFRQITQHATDAARTLKGNFINSIKAAQAAIVGLSFSVKALIFLGGAFTLWAATFVYEAERIEASVSDLDKTLARIGQLFRFDDALGRVRRFGDLTVSELTRSVNAIIDARRSIEAEFGELAERLDIPVIELAFLDAREVLRTYEIYGSGLDNLIKQIEELQAEYNIAEGTIQRFTDRINELKASTEATAKATSSLLVELARVNSRLQEAQSATQLAISQPAGLENYRGRIAAIRSAAQQEINVLRERAETERQLLEETEDDKNKVQARSIDIQTRLRRDIERVQQQSENRITDITEKAAEERDELLRKSIDGLQRNFQRIQRQQADALRDISASGLAQVRAFVSSVIGIQETVSTVTDGIRNNFTETVQDVANFATALERVREIARVNVELGTQQFDLPQLREQANLDLLITGRTGGRATQQQLANVYREYVKAFRDAEGEAYDELDQRILEGSQATAEQAAQGFETAWQDARDRDAQNTEQWQRYQLQNSRVVIRQLQKDLRDRVRLWNEYTSDVVPVIRKIVDEQIDGTKTLTESLKAALRELAFATAQRVIQDAIEKQILIAQERRYQQELIKTAALKKQALDQRALLSAAANVAGLGSIGLLGGVPTGAIDAIQILLQIGTGQIREINTEINKLFKQRR